MIRTWGRVLRLSLAATAVADVLAGASLAAASGGVALHRPEGLRAVLGLVLASLCVYHGGMALNDWADRAVDARERPDRPIPSGALRASSVLLVALVLFALGVACAALVAPLAGLGMGAVAACAALYDLAGRGPLRGPLLLALCRAGNLALPLLALGQLAHPGPDGPELAWLAAPVAYGLYVFVVSRLGRLEDAEDELVGDARPRRLVAGLALLLGLTALLPLPGASLPGRAAALALGLAAGVSLWRAVAGLRGWTRADVERTMGMALRRLLIFTSAVAVLPGSLTSALLALLILAGFPLARALRGVFPPS